MNPARKEGIVMQPAHSWESAGIQPIYARFDSTDSQYQMAYWRYYRSGGNLQKGYAYATSSNGTEWPAASRRTIPGPFDAISRLSDGSFMAHDYDRIGSGSNSTDLMDIYTASQLSGPWTLELASAISGHFLHDTHHHLGWVESEGRHVGFFRRRPASGDSRPQRAITKSTSTNRSDWTPDFQTLPPNDLEPDAADGTREFYFLTPFYASDSSATIYGMIPVYWIDAEYEDNSNVTPDGVENTIDVQLAQSTDGGITWTRLLGRRPFIPRGPQGTWDGGQIYPFAPPIKVGSEYWIYYGGSAAKHVSAENAAISATTNPLYAGLATWEGP